MSRRTLSHFLNRDSEKKKCPCKHFFGLFFTSREREKKIVPPLRGSDFPHAYAWGSRGCAAPPALAPATRETPQQIRPRRNSPEPPAARGSKPSVRRRNRLRPLASRRRIRPPKLPAHSKPRRGGTSPARERVLFLGVPASSIHKSKPARQNFRTVSGTAQLLRCSRIGEASERRHNLRAGSKAVRRLCRASGARSRDARNAEAKPSQREKFSRDLPACAYPRFQYTYFALFVVCVSVFSIHERDRVLPADKKKKRSRGKIRRERFMKPKRKRLKRRAVRRERLREPALLPLRERRLLSPF